MTKYQKLDQSLQHLVKAGSSLQEAKNWLMDADKSPSIEQSIENVRSQVEELRTLITAVRNEALGT